MDFSLSLTLASDSSDDEEEDFGLAPVESTAYTYLVSG